MVRSQGGNVPLAVGKTDPLPILWSITYCGINDSTQTKYVWEGAIK